MSPRVTLGFPVVLQKPLGRPSTAKAGTLARGTGRGLPWAGAAEGRASGALGSILVPGRKLA